MGKRALNRWLPNTRTAFSLFDRRLDPYSKPVYKHPPDVLQSISPYKYNNLFQHINKSTIRHTRLSTEMSTLTKAIVKQMSAHKLTNKVVINGMDHRLGFSRRFHTTQARYLKTTNAGLLLLTSLLREKPFMKTCHRSLGETNIGRTTS